MPENGRAELQYVQIDWTELKKVLRKVSDDVRSWPPWKAPDQSASEKGLSARAPDRKRSK